MKKILIGIAIIIILLSITVYIYLNNKYIENGNTKDNVFQIPRIYTQSQIINGEIDIEQYNEALKAQSIDNITLRVKEGTITRTGATFILTDKNKMACSCSDNYIIEVKKNGKWQIQNPITEIIWNAIIIKSSTEISEKKIEWSKFYGELANGEYRLGLKVISDKEGFVYATFTIK